MAIIKPCGCDFCNDLRNIQPAKYIALANEENKPLNADDEIRKFIDEAKKNKQFLLVEKEKIYIIDKCPVCGYVFDEEDYNSYD